VGVLNILNPWGLLVTERAARWRPPEAQVRTFVVALVAVLLLLGFRAALVVRAGSSAG
jgi:hypothetical protein